MTEDTRVMGAPRAAFRGLSSTARAAAVLATLMWASQAAAQEADGCSVGAIHPDAPPETSQFSFLVGRWDVEVTEPDEQGAWGGQPRQAYWEGHYILDGFAIADYWYDHPPATDPGTHRGVNIRMFNQATAAWDITWQHTEDPLLILTGRIQGENMVLTGQSPDGSLTRIVFSSIRHQSWDWRMELSIDQGASWSTIMRIHAERLAC